MLAIANHWPMDIQAPRYPLNTEKKKMKKDNQYKLNKAMASPLA